MKRFITLFAAALMAVLPVLAKEPDPALAGTETKVYRLSGFDGLSVSSIYQVELTKSSRYYVKVEAPDFLMPYLLVEVGGGTLRLGVEELPRDIRRKMESGRYKIRATVTLPELNSLRMSGAARLDADGDFVSRKKFRMDLSGASAAEGLVVKASEANIEASGAAHFSLTGEYDRMNLRMSGSAKGNVTGPSGEAWAELSGAAGLSVNGKLGKVDVQGSGAANLNLKGSVDDLKIEGSGAAKFDISDAPSRTAHVRMSGAAGARIDVRDELSVSLSGAASLRYRAGDRLHIASQTVSRGASLSAY
ncbi:MAG: DUF2807 domain-containing protein [Bacteroidales bacterium]|nr:DUF2807 domain-containing protein [Bacteroidales bacterium]